MNYLNKLREATLAVLDPATPSTKEEEYRRYQFDGFLLLVKDPLDYEKKKIVYGSLKEKDCSR